jgi:sulfate permease, SulP family
MAAVNNRQGNGAEPPPATPQASTAILRLDLLQKYKISWLPRDILAGVLICAVTIPAALAYGQLAGLQAVNGLYASLLGLAVYAFFGTSRQLIVNPEVAVAILVASSVGTVAGGGGDPARFMALVFLEALMVGGLLVLGGMFRLGFIADFIPKSVVLGFINGMALIIVMAQVGILSGIDLTRIEFFPRIWEFYTKINQFHPLTAAIGASCLVGLAILSLVPLLPEAIVVLVLATLAVIWWPSLAGGVKLVGVIPAGLPRLALPAVSFADVMYLLPVAIGVALVAYVDTTITGRAFAMRGRYRLEHNQEMLALGLANIGSGLFQGFTVGASQSRTAINDLYGGRSQLAGLFAAGLLALFLLRFTALLQNVPQVALASIIFMAGLKLFDLKEVVRLWRTRPASAYFSLATTAAVLVAGLMIGIMVAVVFAIILVLHRLARPHEIVTRPPVVPGLLVYRFAGPVFFFNAPYFATRIRELIDVARPQVTFFLINAEAIVDMDINAADMLEEVYNDLRSRGIVLGICEAKGHFRQVLANISLSSREGFNLYCTLAEAMRELRRQHAATQEQPQEPPPGPASPARAPWPLPRG